MHNFLVFYAPQLVVAASIIGVFIWGAKGSFFDQNEMK